MNNQECKVRWEIMDITSNEPTFYPYNIEVNKCSGSFNDQWSMINIQNYVSLMLLNHNCQSIQSNVKN